MKSIITGVATLMLALLLSMLAITAYAYMPEDSALMMPTPYQDWKTLETPHFRINYQSKHLPFTQRLAAVAETVYQRLTKKMQWEPQQKTEIVVNDSFDGSNGGARILPYNQFYIYMNAPVEGELLDNSPWIEQVFTHELVHILHLDQAQGAPKNLRNVFGRFFFLFPQVFSPSWVTEGIAVYEETDTDKGFGRGQSALYDAMMRAEVQKGLRSFTELSYHGYSGTDWPMGQSYLYGYYFYEFIATQYSEEKAYQYLYDWNQNLIPWRMQARAQRVFGVSAEALWAQFQAYLVEEYSAVAAIEKHDDQQPIIESGMINYNPVWLNDGSFYYYRDDGRTKPGVQRISADGTEKTVADVLAYSHLDVHAQSGVLLSRQTVCDNVNVYTDLYRLTEKGRWKQITQCGRYPRMAWSTEGNKIAAVHVNDGVSSIAILNANGDLLQLMPPLPLGEAIGDIAWSPDDKTLVAAVRREKDGWNIEQLTIETTHWSALTRNTHLEQKPRFSADGKSVYFISDEGGRYNLRRVAVNENVTAGDVETVTQTQTAIVDYSIDEQQNQVRVAEYTANGIMLRQYTLSSQDHRYAAVDTQHKPIQSIVNQPEYSADAFTNISDYSSFNTIAPTSWFAWFYADSQDNSWAQFILQGQDVLGFHAWQLAPAYYFDKEAMGGSLAYIAYHRLAFLLDRDLETVQTGTEILPSVWDEETRYQAVWMQPFNQFTGSLRLDLGIAKEDIVRVHETAGDLLKYEDNLGGVSINWADHERYLHSISAENGRAIKLQFEHYGVLHDAYHKGEVMSVDWREYISLFNNHVLALRAVAGKANNTAKPFSLGNELDALQSLGAGIGFGYTDYTLRGYADDHPELSGENLRLYSAEYRLPMGEWFDGFGTLPIGLGKTAIHLFVDHGAVWRATTRKEYYTGVGVELRPDLLIGFSTFQLQSTLGFAQGLDEELGETTVYFRVGASF